MLDTTQHALMALRAAVALERKEAAAAAVGGGGMEVQASKDVADKLAQLEAGRAVVLRMDKYNLVDWIKSSALLD